MSLSFIVDALGWGGAVVLVVGYAMVSAGRITATGLAYQGINLIGAVALTLNTLWHGALPSVALNVFWGLIALAAIVRAQRSERAARPPA